MSQSILIVDDNPANLGVLTGYLEEAGFEILVARSGESAIQKTEYAHPDLILLDIMLPEIDGFEVCRRLKVADTTRHIPVIFMTALTEVGHKVRGFQVGAVDYITKPLQQEEVLARVKTHLRLQQLTNHLEYEVEDRTRALQREIAERRQIQQQLIYQAALLDKVSDAIISMDLNYVIQSWNRAAEDIYGWTAEEALGQDLSSFLHTDFMTITREEISQLLDGKGHYDGEVRHCHKNGSVIPIWTSANLIVDDQGRKTGIVTINRDITAHRDAESQRIELARMAERDEVLTQLLSSISHDLKTPLTSIEINLYLLERLTDPQKQRDKIQAIKNHTTRLRKLINDLLTVSRLDHIATLPFQDVSVNQLLRDIEDALGDKAQEKQQTLEWSLEEDVPPIQANLDELYRALINVVENAVNYTPEYGTIAVKSYTTPDNVIVEVKDTGIGIPEEEVPLIFERFYRADRARNANTGGSGLGLTIVKRIIEMHNGKIEIESQKNRGTTFRLILPLNR